LLTLDLMRPNADKLEICKYLRGTSQGSLNDFTASISHIQV
jgi:CheY-like chemotaxis protein